MPQRGGRCSSQPLITDFFPRLARLDRRPATRQRSSRLQLVAGRWPGSGMRPRTSPSPARSPSPGSPLGPSTLSSLSKAAVFGCACPPTLLLSSSKFPFQDCFSSARTSTPECPPIHYLLALFTCPPSSRLTALVPQWDAAGCPHSLVARGSSLRHLRCCTRLPGCG